MDERTINLIGINNLNKIKAKTVLIVGLGGVGGIATESLARSGIKNLIIIDSDTFEKSNLNRQILALNKTINIKKTDVCEKRIKEINNDINVTNLNIFLSKNNINILDNYNIDYIVDACDTIDTKICLIKYALEKNIKIISSMGTGKRLDPSKIKYSRLDKTYNDPLAKVMRKKLKENNIDTKIPVVFSEELPRNTGENIGSMMFIPSIVGLYLSSYIINDIIKE